MRKIFLFLIFSQIYLTHYGQIVADHTVVDRYDDIPEYWINEVQKMLLIIKGESHAYGYTRGLVNLENLNPLYDVYYDNTIPPETYTEDHLRVSQYSWGDLNNATGWRLGYGEEDWFTSALAISRTKAGITYCYSTDREISAFGFAWCWDPAEIGSQIDLYLEATQQYADYCMENGYDTKVFFTTGPVDGDCESGEIGYNKYLAYEAIRNYVEADPTRILFDYADILCYDDGSETPNTTSWNGNKYPIISPKNELPVVSGHISNAGALRLGKALWWMLARIAGWSGGTTSIPVSSIIITGAEGATTITTDKGTLQLNALVKPDNATNKTVTWSIINGTGQAAINSTGLVTAISNGTVTAKATANDRSGVSDTFVITISNQIIPVKGITVTGEGDAKTIKTDNGAIQLNVLVLPDNATNKTVTWSIINGTGQATINSTGLVTAISNGTVTAKATANDGSGVSGTLVITISNQINNVQVTDIMITAPGGETTISTIGGTLQLSATVLPVNASNKTVTWTVTNVTGQATINSGGILTAVADGTVIAEATANDGSGIVSTMLITISSYLDVPFIAIVDDYEMRFPIDESYLGFTISLYNLHGNLMSVKLVENNLCGFDISSFRPGLYLAVLSNNMIYRVLKVVIP